MPNGNANSERLDSWKDIASYLRRDVRTVIRWEKEKGLPVRRVPGGQRQAVFAYATELESWLRREDEVGSAREGLKDESRLQSYDGISVVASPPTSTVAAEPIADPATVWSGTVSPERPAEESKARSPKLSHLVLIAAGMLVLLLVAAFEWRSRGRSASVPVRVGFTLNALQAFDGNNQLLWTHTFPGLLEPSQLSDAASLSDQAYIGDFRGDRDTEVLIVAPIHLGSNITDGIGMEVDLFSSRGALLWSYVPHEQFQFGKHEIAGPWCAGALFVTSHDKKQIWVAAIHPAWGNSFVVNLDPATGRDTLRFVNTGTIRALNEVRTSQGNFLLVGGFNNEPDTGSLAVINETKAFAVSPQGDGTRHKCVSCAAGEPDYYFVFPRSEINELEQIHEDGLVDVSVRDNHIEVRKKELLHSFGPQTVYLLDADRGLRPVSIRFDSTYDMLHRKLEAEGRLDHKLENCPERLRPRPIQMWTPAGGWTEIKLPQSGASE